MGPCPLGPLPPIQSGLPKPLSPRARPWGPGTLGKGASFGPLGGPFQASHHAAVGLILLTILGVEHLPRR